LRLVSYYTLQNSSLLLFAKGKQSGHRQRFRM